MKIRLAQHSPLSPVPCSLLPRRAFTLIELLVVISIIAILATLTLTVLTYSQREAKIQRTRSTVIKLDTAIGEVFEKYDSYTLNESLDFHSSVSQVMQQQIEADAKLHFLRDTIRMEMPDSFSDIIKSDGSQRGCTSFSDRNSFLATQNPTAPFPAVVHFYYNQIIDAYGSGANAVADADYATQAAECLYLIIANMNPSALEHFAGSELGDINNNGILEFHDAWGTPIAFMRFAPALVGSDRQADVVTAAGLSLRSNKTNEWTWPDHSNNNDQQDQWVRITQLTPQQFDNPGSASLDTDAQRHLVQQCRYAKSLRADLLNLTGHELPSTGANLSSTYNAWYLYPVIVSAGPDRIFDMRFGGDKAQYLQSNGFSYSINPFDYPVGIPDAQSGDGKLHTFDNIHSHQMR